MPPIHFRPPQATHFLGLAPFLRMSLLKKDLLPIAQQIFAELEFQAKNPELLMNASIVMQLYNQNQLAMEAQEQALKIQRTFYLPAAQQPAKIRLLVLSTSGDLAENTPIDCLLEGWDIDLIFYYFNESPIVWDSLPDFDIVLVASCYSITNQALLKNLSKQLKNCPKPVLNQPQFIVNTERSKASQILQPIPGLLMPPTESIHRDDLMNIATLKDTLNTYFNWAKFPLILRPIDSDAGKDLEKINTPEAIISYLNRVKDASFYLSNFIDYADPQGLYTKIRIVLIAGKAFVCHLAITTDWKIHYLNAQMDQSSEKRDIEQKFMENFDQFIQKHKIALEGIYQQSGLDYIGIDCAEMPTGELLIFEIDHDMIVHGMDDEAIFPYKPYFAKKIPEAFRELLLKRMI